MHDGFARLLARRYTDVKSRHPNEGRRKWRLRVLQEFWAEPVSPADGQDVDPNPSADFISDDDPLDALASEEAGPEIGILVRTDYSNEDAWQAFHAQLQKAETEFAESMARNNLGGSADPPADQDVTMGDSSQANEAGEDADEDDDVESSDGIPSPVIRVINPRTPQEQALFLNISNLTALRLLNDVDVGAAPSPPAGTKRISKPDQLIDHGGRREIYTGLTLWIYDATSNADQSVKLVNQQGDPSVYGAATGDSWRARITHICELQFNMSFLGMKIDFGGLDRWDYSERRRNIEEANTPLV